MLKRREAIGNYEFLETILRISAPKKAQRVCWLAILDKMNTMDKLQLRVPIGVQCAKEVEKMLTIIFCAVVQLQNCCGSSCL